MTQALGRHILCEAYGCDPAILDDQEQVQAIMVEAALRAGADVREVTFHKFSPQGVSGVVVIAESHLAIHTWPELGYAAIDVFTCGDSVDPWEACHYLIASFKAQSTEATEMKRGVLGPHGVLGTEVARYTQSAPGAAWEPQSRGDEVVKSGLYATR
ncbi:MAG: S-adenosylmethionine decarboxylase proenzyme [Limnochordaceae bacterium]|nr:S-adenosylmethionine decarboxylase proenzyme [Limnochordaceae bacterium]